MVKSVESIAILSTFEYKDNVDNVLLHTILSIINKLEITSSSNGLED